MVLDQGQIKEFGSPTTLLSDQQSLFCRMAKDAGVYAQSMAADNAANI